jgi:exodeoxyribonuclease V alpha subunit
MMTANNYKTKYFNGDIGVIKAINSESLIVEFHEETLEIFKKDLADMVPAIAITIHKSQGAEYNTVIIALPANPSVMLQRTLLYTAVTRSKKEIIIVAEEGAVEQAVKTLTNVKRNTKLLKRLKK